MSNSKYLLETTDSVSSHRKLLYVSHSRFEQDWNSILHVHPFTEFFYVVKGSGVFLIDDTKHPIKKDDFIIINANTPHTEKSSKDNPLEYITLGIEGLVFAFENQKEYVIFNCRGQELDPMFYMMSMLKEMEEKDVDYEKICQDLLDVLIIKLIRRNHLASEVTPSVQLNLACLKVKRYIDANYMQKITLESLAELSHLNKYYLVHAFTRQFGCSPINYLCQIRIQISMELLANTSYSVTEIAQSSGFSSQSYFAQCFQKSCGMTASAYRKLCREKHTT